MTLATPTITWCQPASPTEPDVIIINGVVTAPEDALARQRALATITATAERGHKRSFESRGWVVRTRQAKVIHVPVSSSDPRIVPAVTLMYDPIRTSAASAAASVVKAAELASFQAEPLTVTELLMKTAHRPPSLLTTLLYAFSRLVRSMFRPMGG